MKAQLLNCWKDWCKALHVVVRIYKLKSLATLIIWRSVLTTFLTVSWKQRCHYERIRHHLSQIRCVSIRGRMLRMKMWYRWNNYNNNFLWRNTCRADIKSFRRERSRLVNNTALTILSRILTCLSLSSNLKNANLKQVKISNVSTYIHVNEEEHNLSKIILEALQKLRVEQKVMIEDDNASNI